MPWPGVDSIEKLPPINKTRSSIPTNPRCASVDGQSRAASVSNPIPSSPTVSSRCSSLQRNATVTPRALACRTTFVNASCATRKLAVTTSLGGRIADESAEKVTSMPARFAWRLVYHRRAGASPRSSSREGRKIERQVAHLFDRVVNDYKAF